jgi:hypothetical protein
MTPGRPVLAVSAALLLAAVATGALVAAQPGAADRQRTVEGWRVEDRAEEDGGRLVRISRRSGPYRLEYQAAFWHGNDGVIQRVSAIGDACGDDEELDRHLFLSAGEIRRRLAAALARCAAPPRAVRAALRGLDPAYGLALAWNREALVANAEVPPTDGPEGGASALCDAAGGAAERDISQMNTFEAAQAAGC